MRLSRNKATAFAPASIGNVAVGFDILGLAFPALGDEVTVEIAPGPGVSVTEISPSSAHVTAAECAEIPRDASRNTAARAVAALFSGLGLPTGLHVRIRKGIPLSSGLGGSAASAVAAVKAGAALLDPTPADETLLRAAGEGEAAASGGVHLDNAAASLLGGLVLVMPDGSGRTLSLPLPLGIFCAIAHPHARVRTKDARACLAPGVPLADFVGQSADLAAFVAALFLGDVQLVGRALRDRCIEPQRAHLIPGFAEVKRAALASGAIGASISGAGPSVFAWAVGEAAARRAGEAMSEAFSAAGQRTDLWVAPIGGGGARVL